MTSLGDSDDGCEIPAKDGGNHRVFRNRHSFECESCGAEASIPIEFENMECE